jgi:uncharacterized protein YhbP (UPF0306 family)
MSATTAHLGQLEEVAKLVAGVVAAAPKLLATLEGVRELVERYPHLGQALDEAIARAEARNQSAEVESALADHLRRLGG